MMHGADDLLTVLQNARRQLEALHRYDQALAVCAAGLARMEAVLARPPRVVILGEVNSGKTAVAGLLLGMGLLPSSVVANTRLPILIRYAETTALYGVDGDTRRPLTDGSLDELPAGAGFKSLEIGLPSERLTEFEILDTPAPSETGAVSFDGDIRIWCTVATRAWTESERSVWSGLARRNWHNALLVATHKDALEEPSDAAKIEWRLRAAAGDMFRDIILVSATDAGKSRQADVRTSDAGAITLLGQVRVWAAEIRERRARKVEMIVRRLARLTMHQLARGAMKSAEARILKEWEADCAWLIEGMSSAHDDLPIVLNELLRRFARSLEQARPGSIERHSGSTRIDAPRTRAPQQGAPARRFAKLIAGDLTALLRIELARSALRDPTLFPDYAAARAVLLPLARLDVGFSQVEGLLAARSNSDAVSAGATPDQPIPALSRAR